MVMRAPVVGFGSGMYAQALRMYKTDPNFGSFADPHNWALKMLVENGFIVTIIFVIFIVTFFLEIIRLIRKRKEISYLVIFLFTGIVASTIHGLMDFDWSINQLLIIFFIFSGSLYGYLINTKEGSIEVREIHYLPSWAKYILLILTIIAAIISIQFLRADLVRARGDVFYMQKDYENALNSYFESVTLNSHEPLTWYNLWRVYYSMNKFGPAKNSIQKAIEIFPENGIYWGTLARTEEMLGEKENYRESLINAIKYFPANDLSYYVKLVEYDFEQKKYDEASAYIDQVLLIYSRYEKSLWYKNDPNWPVMTANLTILRDFKEKIEKSQG
jgi:tetratricopeptide (TPR) repeat protein